MNQECYECGEVCGENPVEYRDGVYCDDCSSDKLGTCDKCGDMLHEDDVNWKGEKMFCEGFCDECYEDEKEEDFVLKCGCVVIRNSREHDECRSDENGENWICADCYNGEYDETYVTGIVCRKYCLTLEPHTMAEHLDIANPIHKCEGEHKKWFARAVAMGVKIMERKKKNWFLNATTK